MYTCSDVLPASTEQHTTLQCHLAATEALRVTMQNTPSLAALNAHKRVHSLLMQPPAAPCRHQEPHHSLLAFSFHSSSRTDVLRVTGDSYSQELLQPGVDHGAASLLLARMPGDWLLQATSSGIRVVGQDSALVGCWKAPGGWRATECVLAVPACGCHGLAVLC
jgi:hypothetical protein